MTTTTNGQGTINVEQASLRTATVTVQALTIDKRQVTLTVFRQLREEPVVDATAGKFHGLPWGTVNYCPDKKACAKREHEVRRPMRVGEVREHLHVVWQKGDELRRAWEMSPGRFRPWSEVVNDWLVVALAEGWRPKEWKRPLDRSELSARVAFDVDGRRDVMEAWLLQTDRGAWHGLRGVVGAEGYWPADNEESMRAGRDLLDELALAAYAKAGVQDLRELHEHVVADLREGHRVWSERTRRWEELRALPQLFHRDMTTRPTQPSLPGFEVTPWELLGASEERWEPRLETCEASGCRNVTVWGRCWIHRARDREPA
jgi:hypothetical protein